MTLRPQFEKLAPAKIPKDAPKQKESGLTKPRIPWDGKMDVKEYARRERAHFVGRLLLSARTQPDKKGKEPDLQKALGEKDVELRDIDRKKEGLAKTREEFGKRFEDFRKSEKHMGHLLSPLTGEKRDLLFAALDCSLNPEAAKEKIRPEDEEKMANALAEFDARVAPGEQDAAHLAAFLYLKQEQVFEAEDQLNGTCEQTLKREGATAGAEKNLIAYLAENPKAAQKMRATLQNQKLSETERLRSIHDALESAEKKEDQKTLDEFCEVMETDAVEAPEIEQKLKQHERHFQKEQEAIARAQELTQNEKLIENMQDLA